MKIAASALSILAVSAAPALAGGMSEPIHMEEIVITEDVKTSSSSAGLIIPLILIALIAAAASSSTGGAPSS